MPYVLGQSFPRPFAGYTYPRKKRDYFPAASPAARVINESVSHTVTVTDSIYLGRVLLRHIVDTVTVSQIVKRRGFVYTLSVTHDVTASHSIRLNRVYYKSIIHNVAANQDMRQQLIIVHTVTVTDEIQVQKIITRRLSDTVQVTHSNFIQSPRFISMAHNVFVSHEVEPRLATYHFALEDTVIVGDVIQDRIGTIRVSITDIVTVTDRVRVIDAIYTHSIVDNVTVTDKINNIWNKHIQHDVAVTQTINAARHITRTITTLDIISAVGKQDETFELADSDLLFSEFTCNLDILREFEDSAETSEILNVTLFIPNPGPHPPVPGVPTAYGFLTLLETIYGAIILPLPELNDTQRNNDTINVRRSMAGTLHAYIKKVPTQTLSYSFILDYTKALELKEWVKRNFAESIKLTNFKGEIWQVKIVNDDFSMINESRYTGNARQKTTVTLEFEGVKTSG